MKTGIELPAWRVWIRQTQKFLGNVPAETAEEAVREAIVRFEVRPALQAQLVARRTAY